uniref:Uncharacterized protein n=1 Tax=Rhizophora mucronata TaxID=61149 RepID=A0A2P2QHC4_RHIMU
MTRPIEDNTSMIYGKFYADRLVVDNRELHMQTTVYQL